MNQPNDLAIAPDGTLYASDPNWGNGTGQVWRIDSEGQDDLARREDGHDQRHRSQPRRQDAVRQRKRAAQRLGVRPDQADGRSARRSCSRSSTTTASTACAATWTATSTSPATARARSRCCRRRARVLREIDVLGKTPSNLCFGGPDGRTVYVTEVEHKRLVQFRVDRPGLAWKRWQEAGKTSAVAPVGDPADTYPALHLIPWPKSIVVNDGAVRLSKDSRIVPVDESLRPLARILAAEIALLTGFSPTVAPDGPRAGDIVLADQQDARGRRANSDVAESRAGANDGRRRTVSPIGEQAVVEGFDYRATAEGTSTILQLSGQAGTMASASACHHQGLAARRLLRRHARRGPAGPSASTPSRRWCSCAGSTRPATCNCT